MNYIAAVVTERGVEGFEQQRVYTIDPPWPITDEGLEIWAVTGSEEALTRIATETMKLYPSWPGED